MPVRALSSRPGSRVWRLVVLGGLALWAATGAGAESSTIEFGVHRRMSAELMIPDGPGPFPAILLLHTAAGMESYDLEYARRLTGEGYAVLAPYFLRAYPAFTLLKAGRRQIFTTHGPSIYDDLVAGLAVLRAQPKVRGSRVGAVGFSAGGFFAVWLAATGQVQAGVSYYGALTAAGGDDRLERYRRLFNRASSPVLILHGTEDGTVPFAAAVTLDAILTAAQTPHEFYRYPVEHRFDRDGAPESVRAAADAWQRTRAFLAGTLRE